MIINDTHVQGIFLYSPDVEYEKGDFVVSGDSIYICTAANPINETSKTVYGIDPATDSTGNYKMYPGDKISTAQEYYDYVNNRLTWSYKNTKEEVEAALELEPGTLIIKSPVYSKRSDLPSTGLSEGDVYKVGEDSSGYEYAYIPYKEDKYISGNVLNQVLQGSFFGVNEEGIITNYINSLGYDDEGNEILEYSIGGSLANIEDGKILNAIMKSGDLNNGMFKVSRALSELAAYVDRTSNTENILVRQYTYIDSGGGQIRVRIQELIDPTLGAIYYRWAEGIGVSSSEFSPERVYKLNEVTYYKDKAWISCVPNNSGHYPGGPDSSYWKEYSGAWAYDNITNWKSNFSGDKNKTKNQLNDIKAYYAKKINELEATRKQLTGTFCNREVSGISGTNYEEELRARENVRLHSSWDYVDSDEADLMRRLSVSSISDLFTLVSSTSAANVLNPRALEKLPVVIRVGSNTNYTYSYFKPDLGQTWMHGRTQAQLLSEFGVTKLSDIFKIDSETYEIFKSLSPDYPFTVIMKNEATGDLSVSTYKRESQEWSSGKNLFEECDIENQVSTVFYEDLVSNNRVLGSALNGTVGNTLYLDATLGSGKVISVPSIYPVYTKSPAIFRSSFCENFTETLSYFDPNESYVAGNVVLYKYGSTEEVAFIALNKIVPGDSLPGENKNWMVWADYINGFPWEASYEIADSKRVPIDLSEVLFSAYMINGRHSFWESIFLGPSNYSQDRYYPRGSVVYYSGKFYKNNFPSTGQTPSSSEYGYDTIWTILGDINDSFALSYIPDYIKIFRMGGENFRITARDNIDNPYFVLTLDASEFKWLNASSGAAKFTGFFCVIHPFFSDEIGGDISVYLSEKGAYFAFFDIAQGKCYLRSVCKDGSTYNEDESKDLAATFMKSIDNLYGGLSNAIGATFDTNLIISSLTGQTFLNTLQFPSSPSTLNLFLHVSYRDEHAAVAGEKITLRGRVYSSGSGCNYDVWTKDNISYSNISFMSKPVLFTGDYKTLGLTTIKVSEFKSYPIVNIVKAKEDGNEKSDYYYYVSREPRYTWKKISDLQNPGLGYVTKRSVADIYHQWKASDTYGSSVVVFYANRLWLSLINGNTGNTPSFASTAWQEFYDVEPQKPGDVVEYIGEYYIWSCDYYGVYSPNYLYQELGPDTSCILYYGSKYNKYAFASPFVLSPLDEQGVFNNALNQNPAELVVDTRRDSLKNDLGGNIYNHILSLSGSKYYLERVLCSLYPGFYYSVILNGDSYRINNGSLVQTSDIINDNNYLDYFIDKISTPGQLNDTLKYYYPFTVLADYSQDTVYTEEFRYTHNTEIPRKEDIPSYESWVTGDGPLKLTLKELAGSDYDPTTTYKILDFITTQDYETLEGYRLPCRVVCSGIDGNDPAYFVNGNYWVMSVPPEGDSDYPSSPDTSIADPRDLPDAFSLGKVWYRTTIGGILDWYVVQNTSSWLKVKAGNYYDSNRFLNASPWWRSSGGYTSAEEALYDVLHTNYVIHPSASQNERYLGILWSNTAQYIPGDIVVASDGRMWKCKEGNRAKNPVNTTGYWSFYGDPLFETLTYTPSETMLLTSVDPSVPFKVITKIGSPENYYVALNTNSANFSDPCIATILIQQETSDQVKKNSVLTLDLSEDGQYYVNDSLWVILGGDDETKTITLNDTGAKIKNIYYRYKI